MEILYKQSEKMAKNAYSALESFGIEKLLLKRILFEKDGSRITRKSHYHNNYEIHVIADGYQDYKTDHGDFSLGADSFIVIPPLTKHVAVSSSSKALKYAVTFSLKEGSALEAAVAKNASCKFGQLPERIKDGIGVITEELDKRNPYYRAVIENRIFECVLFFLRELGLSGSSELDSSDETEDTRISLIKQYVEDNIFERITLSELSTYCYVSEKQLERIFFSAVGCTVMEYVRQRKCRKIESLLANPDFTLRKISEMMNFGNEYYFNAFFKKYAGMTPGAYRKAVIK